MALGSNLGDREGHLRTARAALAALPDTTLVSASTIEETTPLGGKQQPPYLNQMVLLETRLEPRQLLHALQTIEQVQGRKRTERWGSRTLDLDIVRFGRGGWRSLTLSFLIPSCPTATFGAESWRN